MPYPVKIGDKTVDLVWNQASERAFRFRCSKIGADPRGLYLDFKNPSKAEYAVTAWLWMLLPDAEYRKYALPDDLCNDIDPDDAQDILAAILGVIAEMSPSAEKKSTLRKSPSQESS